MSTKTVSFVIRLSSVFIFLALMVGSIGSNRVHAAGVLYVKPNGIGNCLSWANACTLQTAITSAVSGDEIWSAAGIYKPTTGTTRTATFLLKAGVALYGGFAGTETARDQRNPAVNVTVLSGDLNGDDIGFTNNTENVYHVVTGTSGTILDGFTITAGYADGPPPNNAGGGMYNNSSSPTLINITFINNAANQGGGIYNSSSNPILTNVTFNSNSASYGGGIYNSSSNPNITNVTFSGNAASWTGGGMSNSSSSPTLMNATFNLNTSGGTGGGMDNDDLSNPTLTNITFSNNSANLGGGMNNRISSPTLTNITFSGNSASYGGGMYNNSGSPLITNSTFSGNTAGWNGGGMENDSLSYPTMRNTILWGNAAATNGVAQMYNDSSTPILYYSVVQNGCPAGSTCTNIIIADPKLGALGNHGGFTQTIPLLTGSSAIDKSNDTICPSTDQRGIPRPQGLHCDIGAFEEKAPTFSDVSVVYWANSYIESLYNAGITGGCSLTPLKYCPDDSVTRAQMAVFLLKGVHGSGFTPPDIGASSGFGDVTKNYWAAVWIKQLAAEGITSGCGSGNYCPETAVTRAQMSIFLLKAKNGASFSPSDATGVFSDVPVGYWADRWIERLASDGITGGCGGGNYCPNNLVTRAQMAVFLVKTFGLP